MSAGSWVVVKEAVYMHEVYGPFSTAKAAQAAAQDLATADIDGHHQYSVCWLEPTGLHQQVAAYQKCDRRRVGGFMEDARREYAEKERAAR